MTYVERIWQDLYLVESLLYDLRHSADRPREMGLDGFKGGDGRRVDGSERVAKTTPRAVGDVVSGNDFSFTGGTPLTASGLLTPASAVHSATAAAPGENVRPIALGLYIPRRRS